MWFVDLFFCFFFFSFSSKYLFFLLTVTGWGLLEAEFETECNLWDVKECPDVQHLWRRWERVRIWQVEKLNCDAVLNHILADSTGSSGATVALGIVLHWAVCLVDLFHLA